MNANAKPELFRLLPSVDELLRREEMQALVEREGHTATLEAAREFLDQIRWRIARGEITEEQITVAIEDAANATDRKLRKSMAFSLAPVINATGVILHTNLGRAPLSREALERVMVVARGYCNLELDLAGGERGKRDGHVERLFSKLFGDSGRELATIVVNNNAAGVLLALNALAEGGEVIVSRGELVEIGGSFRIPDVMAKSGAVLREVGTTNRTRIADYERSINERTKLLLRVHRSNFAITGFTEQPPLEELSGLGRKHNVPVMEDLGSGDIFNLREAGVNGEPSIGDSLRAGIDVVTFSGDKLLGGPQAGLITGRKDLIAKMRGNPLFRALRVDKMYYAALEATLLAYLREDYDSLPALRMLRLDEKAIAERAEHLVRKLHIGRPELTVEVVASRSVIGGGAAPGSTLPTWAVAISSPDVNADTIAQGLRSWVTPVIARVEDGCVLLDLRTVEPSDDAVLVDALQSIARSE